MSVVVVGQPIVDLTVMVDPSNPIFKIYPPGSQEVIPDIERFNAIRMSLPPHIQISTGGTAANTAITLARLGIVVTYLGHIGGDVNGETFTKGLSEYRVNFRPTVHKVHETAMCLCLVEDKDEHKGRRTMLTYLGAAKEPFELDSTHFERDPWVILEGFTLGVPGMAEKVMEVAKGMISLDLGAAGFVEWQRPLFRSLIETGRITVLIGNDEEFEAWGEGEEQKLKSIIAKVSSVYRVVVTCGARGCIYREGTKVREMTIQPVKNPLDTTGAGDAFYAGFLYGVLSGCSTEKAVECGLLAGAEAVTVMGARLQDASIRAIERVAGIRPTTPAISSEESTDYSSS